MSNYSNQYRTLNKTSNVNISNDKFDYKDLLNQLDDITVKDLSIKNIQSVSKREQNQKMKEQMLIINESQRRKWLKNHGKNHMIDFDDNERNKLKSFFNQLDDDGSGAIGTDELEGPLISMGLCNNRQEVNNIVMSVDDDESGQIEFKEFMKIIKDGDKSDNSKDGNVIKDFFKGMVNGTLDFGFENKRKSYKNKLNKSGTYNKSLNNTINKSLSSTTKNIKKYLSEPQINTQINTVKKMKLPKIENDFGGWNKEEDKEEDDIVNKIKQQRISNENNEFESIFKNYDSSIFGNKNRLNLNKTKKQLELKRLEHAGRRNRKIFFNNVQHLPFDMLVGAQRREVTVKAVTGDEKLKEKGLNILKNQQQLIQQREKTTYENKSQN